jgi:integrase
VTIRAAIQTARPARPESPQGRATPHGSVTYERVKARNMTLETFLTDYYVPLRLRGRSKESVRLLKHAITQFGKWLGRPATLDDFDDLVVSRFLCKRAEKLAPESVARERSGLIALWNLAQARGMVRLRPCVSPELIPEKTPRALHEEELARLFEVAGRMPGWVGPIPAKLYFPTLIAVLFYSGERITATLSIPRDKYRRPWIVVPPHTRKGKRKERAYELPPWVCDMIDEMLTYHRAPVLFFWGCSMNALRKRWKTITRRAGLGEGREVQFHVIRKSTASHLHAAGGDATAYLGHSSDAVTRKNYLSPAVIGKNKPKPWEMLPQIARGDDKPPEKPAA